MPDPSVRSIGLPSSGNSTSITVNIPTGAQVGDLLLIWAAGGSTPNLPAGWTNQANGTVGATTILGLLLCSRTCQAGDPGSAVVVSGTGISRRIGVCLALKDVDDTTRVDFCSAVLANTTSTNTRPCPTGTAVAGGLQLLFVSDKGSGVIPPNDGMGSDSFSYPAGYTSLYAHRTGSAVNVGDTSLGCAQGPMSTAGAALGGGNWVSHYTNVRAGSVLVSVRSGTSPPPVYPKIELRVGTNWVLADILGVGEGGVLRGVNVLDLAVSPAPPVPELAADFNNGQVPSFFNVHSGVSVIPAAAYSGANGARMTPDGSGITSLTCSGAQFPPGKPWVGFKMRFRLNSLPGATQQYMNLFELGNALVSSPKSQFTCFFDRGTLKGDWNAGEEQSIAATPAVGGWHLIEVRVGFGATSYQSRIRFDGGAVITFNSPATKTPTTASVLWIHYPGTAVDYQMDVDDIALVTSASDPGFF